MTPDERNGKKICQWEDSMIERDIIKELLHIDDLEFDRLHAIGLEYVINIKTEREVKTKERKDRLFAKAKLKYPYLSDEVIAIKVADPERKAHLAELRAIRLVRKEAEETIARTKEEARRTRAERREKHLRDRGIDHGETYIRHPYRVMIGKLDRFQSHTVVVQSYNYKDVISKFGPNPICYLTGLPLDYFDSKSYQLDHFVSRSTGGSSELDNLRLSCPIANTMKNGYDISVLIRYCHLIAKTHPLSQKQDSQ